MQKNLNMSAVEEGGQCEGVQGKQVTDWHDSTRFHCTGGDIL